MSESDSYLISKFRDMNMSDRTDMLNKEVLWIPSENNGSFNGQIVFNCSSLQNSSRWLSYGEATMLIPFVIQAKASGDYTDDIGGGIKRINENSVFLKDGFHSLIDSISVELNQKTLVQIQSFTNMHTQFKFLTRSSAEDLLKNGASTGFFGDGTGMTYNVNSVNGVGYINNTTMNRRIATTAFDPTTSANTFILGPSTADIISDGIGYYTNDVGAGAARYYTWVAIAQIKLRDVCDLFDKMPLCKVSDLRITVNYNSCAYTIIGNAADTPTAGQVAGRVTIQSYTQLSGKSNPTMVQFTHPADTTTFTVQCGVMKSGLTGAGAPVLPLNDCRLYVPSYKIADNVSMAMIQSFPNTRVEYNDIYSFQFGVAAGQPFTTTLTTGIVNPKYLVCLVFSDTSSVAETTGALKIGVQDWNNPYSSAGGTTSNINIKEFNCLVGGVNVLQQNARYSWEMFNEEVAKINALNGNNTMGLTSGVLSYDSYQKVYSMYVVDLSRREASNDNTLKSVVVTGVNPARGPITIVAFIGYQRVVSFDTATGTLSE